MESENPWAGSVRDRTVELGYTRRLFYFLQGNDQYSSLLESNLGPGVENQNSILGLWEAIARKKAQLRSLERERALSDLSQRFQGVIKVQDLGLMAC